MPFDRQVLVNRLAFDLGQQFLLNAIAYTRSAASPVGVRAPDFIGECVFDIATKTFFYGTDTEDLSGWSSGGGGGGGGDLTDGDYGDITVGGTGTAMTINAGAVDLAMLSTDFTAAGKALLDDANAAAQRTTLGLGTAATAASSAFAAASHTHPASDITDFAIEVAAVVEPANTAFDGRIDALEAATSATVAPLVVEVANPSSPWNPPAITRPTIFEITGLTGDLVINALSGSGLTADTHYDVWFRATGNNSSVRTITFSGWTTVLGTLPIFTCTNTRAALATGYTEDQAATSLLVGDLDFAPFADKSAPIGADSILIRDSADSGKTKESTLAQVSARAGRTKKLVYLASGENGTETVIAINEGDDAVGTVVSVLAFTDTGSVTANFQIADHTADGSNYAPTGAASITSMSAISVTTTRTKTAASGANTMAKTGATDRILQIVQTSSSGSPTYVRYEIEYTT